MPSCILALVTCLNAKNELERAAQLEATHVLWVIRMGTYI